MAASGAVSESVERLKKKYLGQDRGNNVKPPEPLCVDSVTQGTLQETGVSANCGGIRHEERALQDLHSLIKMHTRRLDGVPGHRSAGGGTREATSGEGESDGQPAHSRITHDAYTETDVTLTSQLVKARPGFTHPPGTDSRLTSPSRVASRRNRRKSQSWGIRHTRARRLGRRAIHGNPCSEDPACSSHVSWECSGDIDEDEYDDVEDDAASDDVDNGLAENGEDKRWDSTTEWKRKGADSSLGDLRHVYAELEAIHSKLQRESAALAERAVRAAEREGRLAAREEEVAVRHGGALNKLREVQAQVQGTLHALRQQHAAEVQELSEALREKSRENKRIKASFDTLKDMNDSLKKQMSELTEQNKRLETQSHRVQQRLENLQRKFDFQHAQKGRTVLLTQAHNGQLRRALEKPDKQPPPQPHKVKASVGLCELLGLLLSWVPDLHPSPDPNVALSLEKCSKALPLVVEQLSSVPSVSKRLQLPLVNFVLWALGRMDGTSQHTTLTATYRRLGEELFKPGGSTRGAEGSAESSPEPKPHMGGSFFRSSEPEVRLLSSLVILRTLSQADVLAQVLDSVCSDLQSEQSKRLFVRHGGVAVVTALLTSPCRGLLGDAVGVLLLLAMSTDSGCVEEFLAACSTEVWFRSCSQLLRTPHLDPLIPEKMSVILQKLSKIKTNRRLFEACSLHIQLQEMLRTAEPHQVFLTVNLRSTLHQLDVFRGTCT